MERLPISPGALTALAQVIEHKGEEAAKQQVKRLLYDYGVPLAELESAWQAVLDHQRMTASTDFQKGYLYALHACWDVTRKLPQEKAVKTIARMIQSSQELIERINKEKETGGENVLN